MRHDGPSAPSPFILTARFSELARAVYTGLRDGGLAPEATFDLACFLMDWAPGSPVVQELAEQSVAGTDPARLAGLAGQVLAECGFQPDFDTEPRLLAVLEDALEAVRADMRATGLTGPVGLSFEDDGTRYLRNVFAHFRGSYSYTAGVFPSDAHDRVDALVAVADDVQDAVMGVLMTTWPVCPGHGLGAHPREHAGQAAWWCNGSGGHVIALIGGWPG
jgi:hypothetical protein